jgi:anti-sigma factor RsiW
VSHEVICRDFVADLLSYLAGELSPEREAIFDRHLGECPSCVAYMKTYRETIRLGREAMRAAGQDAEPLPAELGAHLLQALLASRPPS